MLCTKLLLNLCKIKITASIRQQIVYQIHCPSTLRGRALPTQGVSYTLLRVGVFYPFVYCPRVRTPLLKRFACYPLFIIVHTRISAGPFSFFTFSIRNSYSLVFHYLPLPFFEISKKVYGLLWCEVLRWSGVCGVCSAMMSV